MKLVSRDAVKEPTSAAAAPTNGGLMLGVVVRLSNVSEPIQAKTISTCVGDGKRPRITFDNIPNGLFPKQCPVFGRQLPASRYHPTEARSTVRRAHICSMMPACWLARLHLSSRNEQLGF